MMLHALYVRAADVQMERAWGMTACRQSCPEPEKGLYRACER